MVSDCTLEVWVVNKRGGGEEEDRRERISREITMLQLWALSVPACCHSARAGVLSFFPRTLYPNGYDWLRYCQELVRQVKSFVTAFE